MKIRLTLAFVAALLGVSAVRASAEPRIYNLDYTTSSISVWRLTPNGAALEHRFVVIAPHAGGALGLAVDAAGNAYTTVNTTSGKPCVSCFEEFRPDGTLVARVDAPVLSGSTKTPQVTDLALDRSGVVYLSDQGQGAAYSFAPSSSGFTGPTVIESAGAATLLATRDADQVFVSGNCGFAAARQYVRVAGGTYQSGACFHIGTIGLYGSSADGAGTLFTPVDPYSGIVFVGNVKGRGHGFSTPHALHGEDTGIALSRDGQLLFVADHRHEAVYVYRKPAGGWLGPNPPTLVTTFHGFSGLGAIAVAE